MPTARLGFHPTRLQVMGQPVGPRVEFRIGQPLAAADKRDGFGRTRCLLLEEFVDATVARKVAARLVPFEEELVPLFIREQRQGAEVSRTDRLRRRRAAPRSA